MAVCTVFDFAGQSNIIVKQRLDAGDRRAFLAEKREGNADFAGMRIQQGNHIGGQLAQRIEIQSIGLFFHQGDKARHMRAFLVGRQENRHGQAGDGGLFAFFAFERDWKAQVFDADLINRQVA